MVTEALVGKPTEECQKLVEILNGYKQALGQNMSY